MKVIDLLNKIANGEELPKKVIFNDLTFKKETLRDVPTLASENQIDIIEFIRARHLNAEVEIVEEEIDIDSIEEIDIDKVIEIDDKAGIAFLHINKLIRAIKQHQREIDKLKEGED